MSRAAGLSQFLFVAATARGGRRLGVRQARSERALAEGLRREKLVLLRTWRFPEWAVVEPRLGLKDQAELNSQLALLLTRGVPLVEALEVTRSVVSKPMGAVVERMRELVGGGSSFSEACRKVSVFDSVTIAVYQAAERTGDLGGAASQLSIAARRQLAVRGKAATVMIYPAIVLMIAIMVSLVLVTGVVPRIAEALTDAGAKLPVYTRAIVSAGVFLRGYWLWVLVGLTALTAAGVTFRARVGESLGGAARRVPQLGALLLAQELGRFFSVMGAMAKAGVPLADALGVANQSVRDRRVREQLKSLRTRLVEGGVLRNLIENVTEFPLATRRLLIAAERAGDLDAAFESLAGDMSDEVDRRAARLLAALEPALIIVMFLVVGSLLLAILIPLLQLPTQLMGE